MIISGCALLLERFHHIGGVEFDHPRTYIPPSQSAAVSASSIGHGPIDQTAMSSSAYSRCRSMVRVRSGYSATGGLSTFADEENVDPERSLTPTA
jgi:hypothetical protein